MHGDLIDVLADATPVGIRMTLYSDAMGPVHAAPALSYAIEPPNALPSLGLGADIFIGVLYVLAFACFVIRGPR